MQSNRIFFRYKVAGFLCATAMCVVPLCAKQQEKLYTATHQQLEVVKIVLAQEAAWNRGDLDGFLSRFKDDPDTQVVLGVRARGMTTIRNAFHTNYPNREAMGAIEYTDIEARELGENFCLATGRYRVERSKKAGGAAEGNFTEVFQKTAQGWQVIFSETT